MNIFKTERHDFMGTDSERERQRKEIERRIRLKKHFEEIDIPILCVPELLEENIKKIEEWYRQGGKINCYNSISPFKDGLAVVTLPDLYESEFGTPNQLVKTGLIDEVGTEIWRCQIGVPSNITILNRNLVKVSYGFENFALLSVETGKQLNSEQLYYVDNEFHDGLLLTITSPSEKLKRGVPQTNKYIYYDEFGNIVYRFEEFASMGQFRNGLAIATKEKCKPEWISHPLHEMAYGYECTKYLINKQGKIVKELGTSYTSATYQAWENPPQRVQGRQVFSASKYHELNDKLPENLKFEEPTEFTTPSNQSKDDIREQLKRNYNPEKEIQRTIKRITYLTNNWGKKSHIDYDENGKLRQIEEPAPYIYFLNRDNVKIDENYTSAKRLEFKK